MKQHHGLLLLVGLQLACDPGVDATYRVSMESAEADSISRLSVVISDTIAQRNGMDKEGRTRDCPLASYHGGAGKEALWMDLCVYREGSSAVMFYVMEFQTWDWGPRGDRLRYGLRDTLTSQFAERFREVTKR
jgi:hypothetical protein